MKKRQVKQGMEKDKSKRGKTPLYIEIISDFRQKIIEGELPDGSFLPSERHMAELLGVHRNTVTKAYNELKAEGFLISLHGVGYKVSYKENCENTDEDSIKVKNVNWAHLVKDEYLDIEKSFDDIFSRSYNTKNISFAGGISSPSVYEEQDISKIFTEVISRRKETSYFYTPYRGDKNLRKQIAGFLRRKGIKNDIGNIQMFSEMNQALDFIVTILLDPGDTVITEEPLSPDVYRTIEFAGARIITVPVDENGMKCDNLGPLIEKHRPKFIYVNSSYQDPTGKVLSFERRKKLLQLSYRYRLPIIEEDAASEIFYGKSRIPSIKAMDEGDNVIYIYSFSLTFIPGVGAAFAAAPKQVIKSLSYLVSVRLISLEWASERMLAAAFENNLYYKKLEDFRREYKEKRDRMCMWLDRLKPFGVRYEKPSGGVYIWCNMPDKTDVKKLSVEAKKKGLNFVPGNMFYPGKKAGRQMIRLNYSYPSLKQIDEGMKTFIKLVLAQ